VTGKEKERFLLVINQTQITKKKKNHLKIPCPVTPINQSNKHTYRFLEIKRKNKILAIIRAKNKHRKKKEERKKMLTKKEEKERDDLAKRRRRKMVIMRVIYRQKHEIIIMHVSL
jgi:hypothetical protein